MSITTNCPSCGKHFELHDSLGGRPLRCLDCDQSFTVPGGAEPEPDDFDLDPPRGKQPNPLGLPDPNVGRPRRIRGRPSYQRPPNVYVHYRCRGSTRISDDIAFTFVSD